MGPDGVERWWEVELGGHGALLVEAADEPEAVARYFDARGITACQHRPRVEEYPYLVQEE